VQAIVGAMETHQTLATRLLRDERARDLFIDVLYELLKRDRGGDLFERSG
jgi:type I restriction enzyme R subunit